MNAIDCFALAGLLGRFLQGKTDLEVVPVNHESDSSLPRLATHSVEKLSRGNCLLLQGLLCFLFPFRTSGRDASFLERRNQADRRFVEAQLDNR